MPPNSCLKRNFEPSPSRNQNTVPGASQKVVGKRIKPSDSVKDSQKSDLRTYHTRAYAKNSSRHVGGVQIRGIPGRMVNATNDNPPTQPAADSCKNSWHFSRTATPAPIRQALTDLAEALSLPGRCLSPHHVVTDDKLHLEVHHGDILMRRYLVREALGAGTFGRVVAVRDLKKKPGTPDFALKITQNTKDAKDDWNFEKDVLFKLAELDPQGEHHFVRLYNAFIYHGHPCLVLEKLSITLHKFLLLEPFRPLTSDCICAIAHQLCDGVAFLHANGLTHTDLKPENVVFAVAPNYTDTRKRRDGRYFYSRQLENVTIRIIDFGSTVTLEDHHGTDVTTRQYRSPEVMMELGWTFPIDVWSIGCILHEIYTSHILFRAPTMKDQLGAMERILGPIPPSMLKRTTVKGLVFRGKFHYTELDQGFRDVEKTAKPLKDSMRDQDPETVAFFDLLIAMFRYDPRYRIKLTDALKHRYFSGIPSSRKV